MLGEVEVTVPFAAAFEIAWSASLSNSEHKSSNDCASRTLFCWTLVRNLTRWPIYRA